MLTAPSYDQGVFGGLLTLPVFLDLFPTIDAATPGLRDGVSMAQRSTNQGITTGAYVLGCFFGAIITIFVGNPLGRKKTIMLGSSIMIVGAILQASAFSLPHLIVGRIITGFGNGFNTSTVRLIMAECENSG